MIKSNLQLYLFMLLEDIILKQNTTLLKLYFVFDNDLLCLGPVAYILVKCYNLEIIFKEQKCSRIL